jgi:hypothetical protein
VSTSAQTTHTSTGFIGRAVVNDDLAILALFSALGLLASFYFMTQFPVEGFLTAWLDPA